MKKKLGHRLTQTTKKKTINIVKKKVIKLTESDLRRIVKRVLSEQTPLKTAMTGVSKLGFGGSDPNYKYLENLKSVDDIARELAEAMCFSFDSVSGVGMRVAICNDREAIVQSVVKSLEKRPSLLPKVVDVMGIKSKWDNLINFIEEYVDIDKPYHEGSAETIRSIYNQILKNEKESN